MKLLSNLKPDDYPLNFSPFEEGNDGAGNYYGLYWPLGQEQQEPLVCFYDHDTDSLTAEYRNLAEFRANQPATPALNDESFFVNPFLKAKLLARKGLCTEAIAKLRISIALFPESADSWGLLAKLLEQTQQHTEAAEAARQAILGNWAFGHPDATTVRLFQELPIPATRSADPLFQQREALLSPATWYAASFQADMPRLWAIIQEYKSRQDVLAACQLLRNYGYLLRQNASTIVSEPDWVAELQTLRPLLT